MHKLCMQQLVLFCTVILPCHKSPFEIPLMAFYFLLTYCPDDLTPDNWPNATKLLD